MLPLLTHPFTTGRSYDRGPPDGSTAGARTAGRPRRRNRSRTPISGRRSSPPPSATGSSGCGSRAMPATPTTNAPTRLRATPRSPRGGKPGSAEHSGFLDRRTGAVLEPRLDGVLGGRLRAIALGPPDRSEEHTSEIQSL